VSLRAEEAAEGLKIGRLEAAPDVMSSAMATAVHGVVGRPGWSSLIPNATPTLNAMPGFDPHEMVTRFRARAEAVRTRGMPPIEGPERQRFREQAQRDFADFAMIGDAEAELVDGILTLRIDLRPPPESAGDGPG
jgi:hypothetical protein